MNSNPTSTSSSSSTHSVSADAISRRAYELWEQEGKPEGSDLRHWLQAEQELGGSASSSNGQSNGQASASAGLNESTAAKNTGTDTRPLQGTRAASAANRERKSSASPFGERAAPGGGQASGTRRR